MHWWNSPHLMPLVEIIKGELFDLAGRCKGVTNLSVGEPDFNTPQHVLDAAVDAMKVGYTYYTPNTGFMESREALAEKLRRENGIEADPATEIIVTVGGMSALSLVVFAMTNSGARLLRKL